METVLKRDACRLCGSKNVSQIIDFDAVPFFDEVVTEENRGEEFSHQMAVYFCTDCRSVQSLHDVDLNLYYESYNYSASASKFVRDYMDSLVEYCFKTLELRVNATVLEVGAADGYLLKVFQKNGARVLGFEPAANLCHLAETQGVSLVQALFTGETIDLIPADMRPIDLVVLLHTFDHLYDPSGFLEVVSKVLNPESGVLIIEVHDLSDIVSKSETALFGHEHATYLHVGSMERLLSRHGLRLIDANFLSKDQCRGSSMLIAAVPFASSRGPLRDLDPFRETELDKLDTFIEFRASVQRAFERLRLFVSTKNEQGERIAGYGAWGRGVTTLAMAGFKAQDLVFVADRNEDLHGHFTPVSSIPIVGPNEVTRQKVDVVIVFNYAYIDEITSDLASFIEEGGRVISVLELLTE